MAGICHTDLSYKVLYTDGYSNICNSMTDKIHHQRVHCKDPAGVWLAHLTQIYVIGPADECLNKCICKIDEICHQSAHYDSC